MGNDTARLHLIGYFTTFMVTLALLGLVSARQSPGSAPATVTYLLPLLVLVCLLFLALTVLVLSRSVLAGGRRWNTPPGRGNPASERHDGRLRDGGAGAGGLRAGGAGADPCGAVADQGLGGDLCFVLCRAGLLQPACAARRVHGDCGGIPDLRHLRDHVLTARLHLRRRFGAS